MKNKYRIEIPSSATPGKPFKFWIGFDMGASWLERDRLDLVNSVEHAAEITETESLWFMEKMPAGTVCYREVQS